MALRAPGSHEIRSPGVRSVGANFSVFFAALLNEASRDKKPVSGNASRRMVMKPAPAAPLEVPKTKLLLEILVVAFNAPTLLGNLNESFHRRLCGRR